MTCFDMQSLKLDIWLDPRTVAGYDDRMYCMGSVASEQIRAIFGIVDKDSGVLFKMSFLFLQSTKSPKWSKKSAPKIGCVTSATVKVH